jgi:fatty-acyl-CoA synthase
MNAGGPHPFETGLDRCPANYVPLSPVSFLTRAAGAFAEKLAVIDGRRRYTYAQLLDRCVRLASALTRLGVGRLDTVAIIAPNVPEMIEAHFAVPMIGAVLNPLNTRLDAATIAFSLEHGSARVLIVDAEFASLARQALEPMDRDISVIDIASAEPSFTLPNDPQLNFYLELPMTLLNFTLQKRIAATMMRRRSSPFSSGR